MTININVCFINVLWLAAMNSDAARIPEENSNWESIDIFLFSNGQQYSPPRKYHLRAEDLNWWSLTLNHLARSQYGSLHSNIQLFTTNGKRIFAPTELQNGSAYVAVKSPDSFIDTGYEKYLIKASRSWERRHTLLENVNAEKSSVTNTIDETIACPRNSQTISNGRDTNLKNVGPILKKETVKSIVGQSDTGSNANTKHVFPKVETITSKNIDEVKLPRKTSILKRNNKISVNSPVLQKKNMDKRIDSKSQDIKVNLKTNTLKPNKISVIQMEQENKQQQSMISSKALPVIQDNSKVNNNESTLVVTENDIKMVESINDLKEKVLDEKQTILEEYDSILINKQDSISSKISEAVIKLEERQTEPVHQLIYEMVSDVINIPTNGHTMLNNNTKPIKESKVTTTQENNESDEARSIFEVYKKHNEEDEFSQRLNFNRKDKITDDDKITIASIGTIFNVKLNIEMKNDDEEEFTIVHKTHLNMKKDKSDKISQVNIDYTYEKEVDGINTRIYVTPKYMQSIYEWDDVNQDYRNIDHIKTLKPCSCFDDPNFKKILTKNNKKYSIFIQPVNHTCDSNRSICRDKRYSIVPPLKKTISETSLLKQKGHVTSKGDDIPSSAISMIPANSNEVVRPHIQRKNEETVKLNLHVKSCSITSNESQKSNISIARKIKNQSQITSVNKYTQTEWCDITLEARLCDDGHYTLHLPPLQVIKFYNM